MPPDSQAARPTAEMPPSTAVAVTAPGSENADVVAVVAKVARLVDGNCATKADMRLVRGAVATRAVRLRMSVAVTWASTRQTLYGSPAVKGSTYCDGHPSLTRHLGEVCGASGGSSTVSAGIADRIKAKPVEAFSTWADSHKLTDLPHAAHYREDCSNCGADGVVTCHDHRCRRGKIACNSCNETGKGTCHSCGGRGSWQVNDGRYQSCGMCYGSGRSGNCHMCSGQRVVDCPTCFGRGTVRCRTCKGHGTFTRLHRTHLQAEVTRTVEFDKDVPAAFRESCLALPRASLASGAGTLRKTDTTPSPAKVSAVLHCEIVHVHAALTVKDVSFKVDAVGHNRSIPLMPAFLDDLVDVGELTTHEEKQARKDPSARLFEATKARVTTEILALVGKGSTIDADAFAKAWTGAVSPAFVRRMEGRIRSAYARAARSSARRVWLWAALPMAGAMVLANAYHLPLLVFEVVGQNFRLAPQTGALVVFVAAQGVVSLPLLTSLWLLAGHRARVSLRAGVGTLARVRPRQGVWPWLGLLVSLGAGWSAAAAHVEAARMGLPYAPASVVVAVARPVAPPSPKLPPVAATAPSPARDKLLHR